MLTNLRLELLVRFGFPDLWLRWPGSILRCAAAAVRPHYVLSSFELWTRPYYERIARDFRTVGRFGYVWDEALGVPFGPRIYNNSLTYALYGALSPRAFRLLATATYLGAVLSAGIMAGHPALAVAIALVLLGSPAGLHALFGYMIKPEVVWWSVALIAVTAALGGQWPAAVVAGGILLLVNASVAAIAGLLLAPLWLFAAWSDMSFPGGAALWWIAPGLLKNVLRAMQARADSLGRNVAAEQNKVAKVRKIEMRELANLAVWFGAPLLLAGWTLGFEVAVIGLAACAFCLANGHLVKLADTVTVLLALLTVLVATALASGAWSALPAVAWFAFYRPFAAFPAMAGLCEATRFAQAMSWPARDRLGFLKGLAKEFPWFRPGSMPRPDSVVGLLDAIPDGARVLLESEGDARGESSHLHFRNWADALVAPRNVELANQFFLVRLVEPALADLYLDRFTAKMLTSSQMLEICRGLGVSHVIAFSGDTLAALESAGFRRMAAADEASLREFADTMHMPDAPIVLLAVPGDPAVIEPFAPLRRHGNAVSWDAKAGQDYVLRYRHHRNFIARQGNVVLPLRPEVAVAGLPLVFMRVTAAVDGPLDVEFRCRWF